METIEKKPVVQGQTRQQLPWHKPLLQRLVVSVDTQVAKPGSAADGPGAFDRIVGSPVD